VNAEVKMRVLLQKVHRLGCPGAGHHQTGGSDGSVLQHLKYRAVDRVAVTEIVAVEQ
jgi:hypothetical protein